MASPLDMYLGKIATRSELSQEFVEKAFATALRRAPEKKVFSKEDLVSAIRAIVDYDEEFAREPEKVERLAVFVESFFNSLNRLVLTGAMAIVNSEIKKNRVVVSG